MKAELLNQPRHLGQRESADQRASSAQAALKVECYRVVTLRGLVFRNVLRNRRRSLLTAASVAVSVLLLVVFWAVYQFLAAPPAAEGDRSHLVLIVMARTSLIQPMPVSYRQRIERLPGVRAVTPVFWFDARYKNEDTVIASLSLDPRIVPAFFPDWVFAPGQWDQFLGERTAAIASRQLARRYGWKVGDHIYVSSPSYFGRGVDLTLRGIYDGREEQSYLVFHWDYLNEVLGRPNVTLQFWILAESAEVMPGLMRQIDEQFRNETVQTLTQTVKQVTLNFVSWFGNIKLILAGMSGAVAFAVLLIVANSMAMSIRERVSELGVLRALGFQTRRVLVLLAAECLGVSLPGALAGVLGAWGICRLVAGRTIGGGLLVNLEVGLSGTLLALACGILIALLSTLLPALRASRLNIAEALRRTD
jgi:putative ABC transport system permease protein